MSVSKAFWRLSASVFIVAAATQWSAAAHAQDVDAEVDATRDVITVTTQKREQDIIDVPINLTAYDEEALETLGIEQFDELSLFVPGLLIQEQSPNNPGFVIRGITSDSGDATTEARVAVFQDGVSISRARGAYVELFDIERVEVAKGPQATLFGRGALIGGINIIQNKADVSDFIVEAAIAGGNEEYRKVEGMVNMPLIQDVLGLRVAAISKERDGYVDNALGGEDFNGQGVDAFRATLSFEGERASFDLIANYQEDDQPGTAFKSGTFAPEGGDTLPWTPAALNTFGGFEGGKDLGIDREVRGLTALGSYDLTPALTLNAIAAYRDFESLEIFDPDGFAQNLLVAAEDAEGEQTRFEARLNFDDGGRVTWFAGASYFDEEGSQRVPLGTDESIFQLFNTPIIPGTFASSVVPLVDAGAAQLGAPAGTVDAYWQSLGADDTTRFFTLLAQNNYPDLALFQAGAPVDSSAFLYGATALEAFAGSLAGGPFPIDATVAPALVTPLKPIHLEEFENQGETTSYDVFADVTVQATERLELIGGVRYTYDEKTSRFQSTLPNGTNLVFGNGGLLVQPTDGVSEASDEFDAFTYRLVANYALNDNANLFASVANGRRPEVITISAPSTGGGETPVTIVPAEEVQSFEVGAKARVLDNQLDLEGSIFYFDYDNFQTSGLDPNAPAGTVRLVTINAGEASAYGFEGLANWAPIAAPWFEAYATYAYNNARLDSGAFEGNRFRLSPDHSASLALRFPAPVGEHGTESFVPTYTYQSKIFFDENNDLPEFQTATGDIIQDEFQDAYGLVNLRARFEHSSEVWALEAFMTNALDEEYIIDAGNTGDTLGLPTFIAGAPRLYGLELSGRF